MITSFSIRAGLSLFSLHCEGDCARKGNNTIYNTQSVRLQSLVSTLGGGGGPHLLQFILDSAALLTLTVQLLTGRHTGGTCVLSLLCVLCAPCVRQREGIIEKSHTSSLWNISSKLLSVQSTGRSSVSYVRISFLFICENSKNDQFNHK